MTSFGYTLSSEEHGPRELVRLAAEAEAAGFDFLTISDHFHPWIDEQGHSPFVWATLGGIAQVTKRVQVGTGVTCPILRIHPAIVAHAAATASRLFEGRFFLGVGTGEALNEHILGQRWPALEIRLAMLEEAVDLMRTLWKGDVVDHHGTHFTVENARVYDAPSEPIPVVVSAMGDKAAVVAGRIGDGLWSTSPEQSVVDGYTRAGGNGRKIGQLTLCWAQDRDDAVRTAHRVWPTTGVPGQLSQDLPTPTHFAQAASLVTPELIGSMIPCGPDPGPVLEKIAAYEKAGFDHVHLHQIGPDQAGFFQFWRDALQPRLR